MKERANAFFKAGEWQEAQEDYFDAVRFLKQGDMPPERRREAWDLLLACWLNEAQCSLNLEQWQRAIDTCTEVLKHDGKSVKARFRRAAAYTRLDAVAKAKADLQEARRLDPTSREVVAALKACLDEESSAKRSSKVCSERPRHATL